jgi:hypothetical protein
MASTATEMLPPGKPVKSDDAEETTIRARRSRTSSEQDSDCHMRYFLSKSSGSDGKPILDREVANEGEALVEALRLGVTFYAVQEFRVVPDFSGRKPQLTKEAVSGK